MSSAIVYADRSMAERGARSTFTELARKVHAIKPYLTLELIEGEARAVAKLDLLTAVA
jgi:hypothetical protein